MLKYLSITEPFEPNTYLKRWKEIENKVREKGFTWATLYENDTDNQYMSDSLLLIPRIMYNELQNATKKVHQIFQKTFEQLSKNRSELYKLGVPVLLWDTLQEKKETPFSYFIRYDFIASSQGLKVIEANADTPLGIVESAIVQETLCNEHRRSNPNAEISFKIKKMMEQIIKDYYIDDILYFTSVSWHEEDQQTIQYFMKMYPKKAEYIPLEEITVTKNGVYTAEGNPIHYLFRLYPLEMFVDETSYTGEPIGVQFISHIIKGKIKIINPPSAVFLQSKAILALITEKKEEWFTTDEQKIIEKYFLPTYFSPNSLSSYVKKPVLGREGGGVQIVCNGKILAEDTEYYQDQPAIYQQYFPMPDQAVDTWDGTYVGKLLIGSHVINNEPSGLFFRVGEHITGNLSMFVAYSIL